MWGEQLAGQWHILQTIESRNHGVTVAELAQQEGCHTRTIWRNLAAIQGAGFPDSKPMNLEPRTDLLLSH